MGLEVGAVLDGKVSGITKFGAFVSLEGGKSGLVHISEIANTYVNEVSEHVQLGQSVKVLVLGITPDGKINLSIKRTQMPERRPAAPARAQPAPRAQAPYAAASSAAADSPAAENQEFEDRLKKYMQDADSRIAGHKVYSEHRQRSRRK